jgi:hypothetical protein
MSDRRLVEIAVGARASFNDFAFLERSGAAEVTLSGQWPTGLHTAWTAEIRRLGWRLIDQSKPL